MPTYRVKILLRLTYRKLSSPRVRLVFIVYTGYQALGWRIDKKGTLMPLRTLESIRVGGEAGRFAPVTN